MSLFVICDILELFVNTLTGNDKYSLHNREDLQQPIQIQLSKKQKKNSEFFAVFLKFTSNFEHFEKNITFIAHLLAKLRIANDVVK